MMRKLLACMLAIGLFASACGGGSDTAEEQLPAAEPTAAAVDDAPSDEPEPTPQTPDTEPAEAGGTAGEGLVEELGLPSCPVGAYRDVAGPVEISFWHPYSALTAEAMDDLAAAFNASQSDIVVTVEAQGSYGELLAKYRESIGFDDLPAIVITDIGAFREMVDSDTVLPAQSCVEAEGVELDSIDQQVRAAFSIDGALYPASMTISTPVLFYNRTHFAAAGLDPDDPPGTLAELAVAAQALKDTGVAETPLSLVLNGWFVEEWLYGAGVPLVNADNGRAGPADMATFNGAEALELYTLLRDMNDAGLIVSFSNTPGQIGQYLAATGPASMLLATSTASTTIAGVLGGTANLSELVDAAGIDGEILGTTDLKIDLDVAPFPGLRDPGQVFMSGGGFYMTNTGSDAERAAAWEFLKFVNEVAQQKVVHLKGSYLPINSAVLNDPEVQTIWQTDSAGQWLATAYAQLAGNDKPGPAIGPFSEEREIIERSLEDMILAGADPATVLADAEQALNEALADYADANF